MTIRPYSSGLTLAEADRRYGGAADLVAGLRRPAADSLPSAWQRIRVDGSPMIDTPAVYFANHPIYSAIQTVLIDGQYMVKIPKFYYRIVELATGGVEYYISPTLQPGFAVHPAFFSAGWEIDQFWVGAYHASNDPAASGVKLASLPDVMPQASLAGATAVGRMAARNTGGVDGFGSLTWHQICAIKLLALVEIGTPDVRTAVGQGWNATTSASTVKATGTSDANWRGIYDLWGLMHTLCMGIEVRNGRYWVADESGVLVDAGVDQPTSNYIATVHRGAFDWAFLPKTTGASTSGYMAHQWANNAQTNAVRHGGAFSHTPADVGLFTFNGSLTLAYTNTAYGFRLAKV
ncbi:hypothetical protein D9M70_349420 [compost metagenome]